MLPVPSVAAAAIGVVVVVAHTAEVEAAVAVGAVVADAAAIEAVVVELHTAEVQAAVAVGAVVVELHTAEVEAGVHTAAASLVGAPTAAAEQPAVADTGVGQTVVAVPERTAVRVEVQTAVAGAEHTAEIEVLQV